MSLSENVEALADRVAEEINTVRSEVTSGLSGKSDTSHNHDSSYYTESETDTLLSGKANSSHNHGAGDINSGTLAIARVPTGTSGTTVALGNHDHSGVYAAASHTHDDRYYTETEVDSALSGKAAATHTHSGVDIVSDTVPADFMPPQQYHVFTDTTTNTTPFNFGNVTTPHESGYVQNFTLNHNSGLTAPSVGMDRQVLRYCCYASGAQRTFTLSNDVVLSTGLESRVFTIPSGKCLFFAIEWTDYLDAWVLTAATVTA